MTPALARVGTSRSPVVTVDDLFGNVAEIKECAAALAPFPPAGTHYPGLRRRITRQDGAAVAYVQELLKRATRFIGSGFDASGFELIEASFSLVTQAPDTLSDPQRGPHFDSTDPDYLAVMHYLSPTPGTAFFRQKRTGIEIVDEHNIRRFVDEARRAAPQLKGYITDSNDAFERIGEVDGRADRLVIYRGGLLHSGLIPAGLPLSDDPRQGRLTANIFLKVHHR